MKLDTLTKLNHKRKTWLTPKHPLFFESLDFKITYSAGIFMHAGLNKTVNTLNNFELERIMMKGLGLSNNDAAGVIKLAKEGKRIVDDIIEILNTPVKKYLFLLDLISVSMRSTAISEEEMQSISIFTELFRINKSEEKLLFDFISYAYQLSTNECIKTFEIMLLSKMPITMSELKFYIPEIEYVTTIENKVVKPGGTLRLVDHCKISDTIMIPKGTSLIIDNATIEMYGSIIVDGGQLIIKDSQIINRQTESKILIQVKNFSEIELYHSSIDCRYLGGAINQENGNLKIDKCRFINTTNYSAVKFWGNQLTIKDTLFKECFSINNGGAIYIQNGRGIIESCRFEDCEGKNGGAIHTTNEIMILNCRFKFCKVTGYGSAVYYKGEVKSNVSNCEYYECYPEREELIQYIGNIEEKTVTKEYTIKVSTILDMPFRIKELGILSISDAVVYMNQSIICQGLLNIKNSKLIALDIKSDHLFILERSRGCLIESSEFDGRNVAGIFWASGTGLHIQNSLFRNTTKGRAIYDSYEPKIKKCIFSNCLNGAISACAGEIINCSFINCRDKSGAGILIYGMKGVIRDCEFVRCTSEYSGGAIDRSGGHKISDCTYEECKPNNIN